MVKDIHKQADDDGQFRRQTAQFRDTVSADHPVFRPEPGRYLLYGNYLCPWVNRTLITRKLKKLEDVIDVSILDPRLGDNGWYYSGEPGTDKVDPVFGAHGIKEIYLAVNPDYDLRYTIPVLFDKKNKTIVNNESSEIIRILNAWPSEKDAVDLYPEALRAEINEINAWVYDTVNNGVYKTGFAGTQTAYDEHVQALFKSLERLDKLLADRDYLVGPGRGVLTEADVRLYPTIARFDQAYYTFFLCNWQRIQDFPNLYRWFVALYNRPEFQSATNFDAIKKGYAGVLPQRVATIVPIGPKSVFRAGDV